MNMMFCSDCDKNGTNQMYLLVGNVRKNIYKVFIYPFEIKDKYKTADTSISENEFNLIDDVSDSDRQFLEAMIDLKKKDPIEYQLKLSQFKTQLQQQESSKSIEEDNKPKCPTCGSTNIEKISLGKKAVGGALFGLFSSDVRKTMHCKNCGFKW